MRDLPSSGSSHNNTSLWKGARVNLYTWKSEICCELCEFYLNQNASAMHDLRPNQSKRLENGIFHVKRLEIRRSPMLRLTLLERSCRHGHRRGRIFVRRVDRVATQLRLLLRGRRWRRLLLAQQPSGVAYSAEMRLCGRGRPAGLCPAATTRIPQVPAYLARYTILLIEAIRRLDPGRNLFAVPLSEVVCGGGCRLCIG